MIGVRNQCDKWVSLPGGGVRCKKVAVSLEGNYWLCEEHGGCVEDLSGCVEEMSGAPEMEAVLFSNSENEGKAELVQRLYIPPGFEGSYVIKWRGNTTKKLTRLDGWRDLMKAIRHFAPKGQRFIVRNPEMNIAHISLEGGRFGWTSGMTVEEVNDVVKSDSVDHPSHYTKHASGVECIKITEHLNFCLGNALKYIWRADEKGDALQDLEKAKWYIEREIQRRLSDG